MQVKVEKLNCPNCNSTQMEIDYDNYVARCPHCDATYPIEIENGEAIFLARELRKTMESEYEEQRKKTEAEYEETRKTVEFLDEEERKRSEFNRTKGFRNASDKLKWAKRGTVVGLVVAIALFILSRNVVISILSLAAVIIVFIPKIFDENKTLNTWTKIISIIALIGLGAYSGYINNARNAAHMQEQQTLANEAAAAKIPLGVSSKEVIGIDYHEAVRLFESNGFIEVKSEAVDDLDIQSAGSQDTVISVTIKGNTAFDKTDIYPENVKITVAYHNLGDEEAKIQVGTGSEDMVDRQCDEVEGWIKDAGFINIERKPIYDLTIGLLTKEGAVESVSIAGNTQFYSSEKFRYDSPVQITYHLKKSEEKNNHEGELQIPSSSKKYKGRNYEDVEKELRNAGFENIEISRKEAQTKKEKSGEIVLISVNGKTDFDEDDWFVKESNIIITYYGPKTEEELKAEHPDRVKVPDSAKNLKKKNYEDVVSLLTAEGFINISAEPLYDLKKGIIKKEGSIESLSIDGNADFGNDAWFAADVEVKITYHAFKEKEEDDSADQGILGTLKGLLP